VHLYAAISVLSRERISKLLMGEILDRAFSESIAKAGWRSAICVVKRSFGGSRESWNEREKKRDVPVRLVEERRGGERERRADSRTNGSRSGERERLTEV